MLAAIRAGNEGAVDRLVPLVYDELRKLAGTFLANERPGHTLQPTALVHEAYLRLLGDGRPPWNDKAHFFRAAGQAMRRILIERARARARHKRGGDWQRVSLDTAIEGDLPRPESLLDLDRALSRLAKIDSSMAEVVELRYFAGLTVEQIGNALEVSPRSVQRLWTAARAWLHAELTPSVRRDSDGASLAVSSLE